jgi:hypothetical protein
MGQGASGLVDTRVTGRSASARFGGVGHAGGMHEAGAVGGAIEKVIHDWPKTGTGGQLELEIRDATRAEAESVAFQTSAVLAHHGYGTTTFTVLTSDVHCVLCGELAVTASPAEPRCDHCGASLPEVPGPAVVCREVAPCA